MKKILFITPDFYPNSTGFANASINLINSINKYGKDKYKIYVFTDQKLGDNVEFLGASVFRYEEKNKIGRLKYFVGDYKKIAAVEKYIRLNNIDIIFFETNTFPFFEYKLLKKYEDKCVVRIHSTADTEVPIFSNFKSIGAKIVQKEMFNFMKKIPYIISTSEYYLNFIKRYYLNNNVYDVWDNKTYGILYNTSVPINIKSKSIINNTFLTMGKMSENGLIQKGIVDLLKAVYLLKKRNQLPEDFKLNIIGKGVKLNYVISLIDKLSLKKECNIIEEASHEEVFELMNNSKAIILLSRYEGQSMFITESISMGKPIIISKYNGMGDMLEEGINGYSVITGNIEDAAIKIKKMIDLSENDLKAMGNASRNLYDRKFSPKKVYEMFDILMTLKD